MKSPCRFLSACLLCIPWPLVAAASANPEANVVAPGWERSYQAGMNDPSGHYLGGAAINHIVAHQGVLFAGNSYWCDSRNPWYGGEDPNTGWGQILRLDRPGGSWAVEFEMGPQHLRCEILKSVRFQTDGASRALKQPVDLLLASTFTPVSDRVEVSLFTRDDVTGKWTRSTVYSGEKPRDLNDCGVRAMCVHRDKVTGVDRLFLSIGKVGIFSGVYDEGADGKVKGAGVGIRPGGNAASCHHRGKRRLVILGGQEDLPPHRRRMPVSSRWCTTGR